MTGQFYNWSKTAGTNASADISINWAEGQPPSSVNDSARAMMAATASWRDDISGVAATGGTATAYTYSTSQGFPDLAHMDHALLTIYVHTTNGDNPTLNVDGLGAVPIYLGSVPVPAGVLVGGCPYSLIYYQGASRWILKNFFQLPYTVPIGGMIDYFGAASPSSNFVFPVGQAISRTTYSALFALFGTFYGAGDGSTTFGLPDLRGRVTAAPDGGVGRLTSAGFGATASLGAVNSGNSGQVVTLTANLIPTITSGVSVSGSISGTTSPVLQSGGAPIAAGSGFSGQFAPAAVSGTFSGSGSATSNNTGGSSTTIPNVQPTIIANKLLRII